MPEETPYTGSWPSSTASKPANAPSATGKPTLGDLKDRVSDDLSRAADAVGTTSATVMTKVQDTVAEQKNFAAPRWVASLPPLKRSAANWKAVISGM